MSKKEKMTQICGSPGLGFFDPYELKISGRIGIYDNIWLVVWNIFNFPIYWECHHPNWWTPSFFRGVGIPPTRYKLKKHGDTADGRNPALVDKINHLSTGADGAVAPGETVWGEKSSWRWMGNWRNTTEEMEWSDKIKKWGVIRWFHQHIPFLLRGISLQTWWSKNGAQKSNTQKTKIWLSWLKYDLNWL